MSKKLKVQVTENYLLISDEGTRSDLTGAIKGTENIVAAAKKYNRQLVLADYRKVHYDIPLTDAYNLVKVYENKVPEYRSLIMAAVVDRRDREIAKFWESVSLKRGYSFKIFDSINDAENWLKKAAHSTL